MRCFKYLLVLGCVALKRKEIRKKERKEGVV